jgi:hypothetical protein
LFVTRNATRRCTTQTRSKFVMACAHRVARRFLDDQPGGHPQRIPGSHWVCIVPNIAEQATKPTPANQPIGTCKLGDGSPVEERAVEPLPAAARPGGEPGSYGDEEPRQRGIAP